VITGRCGKGGDGDAFSRFHHPDHSVEVIEDNDVALECDLCLRKAAIERDVTTFRLTLFSLCRLSVVGLSARTTHIQPRRQIRSEESSPSKQRFDPSKERLE
jgi:hypothetical protein